MTKETIQKLIKHFKNVAEGNLKTGNPTKDALIVSDAKINLKKILEKHPEVEEIKATENKSKGKK